MKDLCLQSVHKWHRGASLKHNPSNKKNNNNNLKSCSLTPTTFKQLLPNDLSSFVSFQPDAQEGNTLQTLGKKKEIRGPGDLKDQINTLSPS